MHNRSYSRIAAAWVIAAAPFASSALCAAEMDGSSDIVCAVVDVVGCAPQGECVQGRADSFDLPRFMIVDTKNKTVRASYESREAASSPVKNLERSGNHLILQGVENGRGWEVAIDTQNGSMSAAGVGDAVSFLVFGACTAL